MVARLLMVFLGLAVVSAGVFIAVSGGLLSPACNPNFTENVYPVEFRGTIRDGSTQQSLNGATVGLYVGGFKQKSVLTPPDGSYFMDYGAVGEMQITIRADKTGYSFAAQTVTTPCYENVFQNLPVRYTIDLTINPAPVLDAGFTYTVSGNSAQFSDTSSGGPTSWHWDFGDGTSADTSQTTIGKTYSAPGTYTVKMTITRNTDGATDSATAPVTIASPPPPGQPAPPPTSGTSTTGPTDPTGEGTTEIKGIEGVSGPPVSPIAFILIGVGLVIITAAALLFRGG